MKTSLLSLSIVALVASSMSVQASSVTIPNSFTAGTTAVAADVNANFNAVAAGVNDNDARITTNTADIATNTADVATNTADVATNTADVATNTADIATNTADIATNTADIATNTTDIANLQASTSCSADMVAVGSLCVDIYEASVWDAATGGTQITGALPCGADGNDCGATAANPIYARSVVGVTPRATISWYQAAQACANVGKRLPTTAEWSMAASGSPLGPPVGTDPTQECNVDITAPVAMTGASAGGTTPCVSSAGAFDMAGNLWEWSTDLTGFPVAGGFSFTTSDALVGVILGGSFNSGNSQTAADVATVGAGPTLANSEVGFRCVR